MLEQEISSLRLEIVQLREAVISLTATLIGVAHALPTTPVQAVPDVPTLDRLPDPTPTPAPAPAPEPVALPEPKQDVTVDTLQAWCMETVRSRPELKDPIRTTIASFDGAKTLKRVPPESLPQLKIALEALL